MAKMKLMWSLLKGHYAIIKLQGISVIVSTDLTKEQQRKASWLFFKEAHTN